MLPPKVAPLGRALYTFLGYTNGSPDGSTPYAGLVQGSDGYFYGTTGYGGTNNSGTVFKISATGPLTILHTFNGTSDGARPWAGLVQGTDGSFYGTTTAGGPASSGTVFKINGSGTFTNLYSFTAAKHGAHPYGAGPYGALVRGGNGYFYGTTISGGTNINGGTVFRISTNGVLTSLYSFTGGKDGANPWAGLAPGRDGNFYGTTIGLGSQTPSVGNVFRLTIVTVPPVLAIVADGANVTLTWPANAVGLTLQSATNLGPSAVWITHSPAPTVVGGLNVVTNPLTGPQMFFRLFSQ